MDTCDQTLQFFETSSRIAERVRTGEHASQWDAGSGLIGLEASSSRSDDETQEWLMLSTLLINWCFVCSVQFGSPKMVTTMIRRVISERLNGTGAIRRKTGIFIRTNELALITTIAYL